MSIPTNTSISQSGTTIEFRSPFARATLIVRVSLDTPTPRILVAMQLSSGEIEPTSLYLDEVESYIATAKDCLLER